MQALSGRLGKDFQPRLQRIVGIDQGQMGLPALKQLREQPPEMLVDGFECGAKAFASLAVEIADRAAQPIDRFGQFGLFGWRCCQTALLLRPVRRQRPD